MNRKPLIAVALLMAAGCGPGHDFVRPAVKLPDAYHAQVASETAGGADLAQWWTIFHEPVMERLIADGLAANLDVRIAGERLREARFQYRTVAGKLGPQVNAVGSAARAHTSANNTSANNTHASGGAGSTSNLFTAGFDATWEIDVFGGVRRAMEAGTAEIEAAQAEIHGAQVSVAAEVAAAYLDWRHAQRRQAVLLQLIGTEVEVVAIERQRATIGIGTDLAAAQATVALEQNRARLPAVALELSSARNRLALLLNDDASVIDARLAEIPLAIEPVLPAPVPAGLPSELLRRRPDVLRAERLAASAAARVGVGEADLYPRFVLTGSAGLQSVDLSDLLSHDSKYWSISPRIVWPIFSSGQIRNQVHQLEAREQQALLRYEQTVRTALSEVDDALEQIARQRERAAALRIALAASRDALTLADARYRQGLSDFTAVAQAQLDDDLLSDIATDADRLAARALVALCKALGGGWDMNDPTVIGATTKTAKRD